MLACRYVVPSGAHFEWICEGTVNGLCRARETEVTSPGQVDYQTWMLGSHLTLGSIIKDSPGGCPALSIHSRAPEAWQSRTLSRGDPI